MLLLITGNYGNMLDGRNDPVKSSAADAGDADDEAPLMTADEDKEEDKDATDEDWHSITEPFQPLTNDRSSPAGCLLCASVCLSLCLPVCCLVKNACNKRETSLVH